MKTTLYEAKATQPGKHPLDIRIGNFFRGRAAADGSYLYLRVEGGWIHFLPGRTPKWFSVDKAGDFSASYFEMPTGTSVTLEQE